MVKLELYRVFREVAEAGNISLAAENLYLSQSAVSQSVKQLEQQLGTRLSCARRAASRSPRTAASYLNMCAAPWVFSRPEKINSSSRARFRPARSSSARATR